MDDLDLFDASYFRISPAEASKMDPQQRMLLENACMAFDDAGLTKETLHGLKVGVFVGIQSIDAAEITFESNQAPSFYSANGSSHSMASGALNCLRTRNDRLFFDTHHHAQMGPFFASTGYV